MEIERDQVGAVLVLRNIGDIADPEYRSGVESLIEQGHQKLVLNAETLRVRTLTFAYLHRWRQRLIDHGGDLVLVRPTDALRGMFAAFGFDKHMIIYDREEEGIAHFYFPPGRHAAPRDRGA